MNRQDLIEQLTHDLAPVKPLGSPLRDAAIWFFVSVFFVAMSFLVMPVRGDLEEKVSQPIYIIQALCLLAVSFLSAMSVSWISRPGRKGQRILPFLATLLLSLFISIFSYKALRIIFHVEHGAGCDLGGIQCMGVILMLSLLPCVFFFWTSRKAAPIYPGLSGVFIGLASGTVASTALAFSCNNDEILHLLTWHFFLPFVTLGAAGYFIGRKYLRW